MEFSNRSIMWAVSAALLMFSGHLGFTSYQTQSLPDLDSVEEWNGVLPEYEEMDGKLSGEKGTWVKATFALNEGVIGEFDCYGVYAPWDERTKKIIEVEQESYNISIIWEDPNDDEYLLILDSWVNVHPDLEFYGRSSDASDGDGCWFGRYGTPSITVSADEGADFLRGLFLILEGDNESEEWYLVSVGHDENGGFGVEPSVDDNKLSKAIWSSIWGLLGLFILHSSFDSRNK
ncbi:MAG: hypothetical protein VYB40_05920 [Candidatus Thermoplasmatota archaeon]|nr:hypothetical protein [Candidatus Thermoplasmatota archaeon]